MSCNARGFFCPDAFLILARLFWNQIFICASLRPNSPLNCCRRLSVKYLFSANSCFNRASCAPLNAVRGRFSSLVGPGAPFGQDFFTRRDRGPGRKSRISLAHHINFFLKIIRLHLNAVKIYPTLNSRF